MGNRANVYFASDSHDPTPGVYLHWNGEPESVYAFVAELRRRMADRGHDPNYMPARFAQVVGDFFDSDRRGDLSLGLVSPPERWDAESLAQVSTDPGDNGFYLFYPDRVERYVYQTERTANGYRFTLRPFTPMEVDSERRRAEKSDTYAAIGRYFAELDARRYGGS